MLNGMRTLSNKTAFKVKRFGKVFGAWQLYLLILPAVLYVVLFHYLPMYGVVISFKDFRASKGILESPWVGLKHFQRFFNYPDFGKIMLNTIRISLYSLLTFPLPVFLALMLNELRSQRFKKVSQILTYAPHFLSTVVVCQLITIFLDRSNGLVNNILGLLGNERIPFLEIGADFPAIYVWSDVWQNIGWDAIIYIAALSGVSPDLVEAAQIDGAKKRHIIWHIHIPTIMPTIIIMLILRCGSLLNVGFEKTYLLRNSLNLDYSQVISTYIYELGLINAQFSYSSAIGLFNTVINVLLLLIVNAIAKKASDISLW
jgi:putative aldouronate transport system permease protein